MRDVILIIAAVIGIVCLCLCLAYAIIDTQERHEAQLFNRYWPFTVETQVRDR